MQQNYPNPFKPNTRIQYNLPTAGQVHLTIYTPLGQKIRTLVDEVQSPGLYLQSWDGLDDLGRSVASGTYLYHLEMRTGFAAISHYVFGALILTTKSFLQQKSVWLFKQTLFCYI